MWFQAGTPFPTPASHTLGSLKDAVVYAQQQVKERPAPRCTIYDDEGLVGLR
jgi:hypothetical protein